MHTHGLVDKLRENIGAFILMGVVGTISVGKVFVKEAFRHYDPGHQQLAVHAAYCSALETAAGDDEYVFAFVQEKMTIPNGPYQGWTCGKILDMQRSFQK